MYVCPSGLQVWMFHRREKSLATASIQNSDYPAYTMGVIVTVLLINIWSHDYMCMFIHLLDINETLYE